MEELNRLCYMQTTPLRGRCHHPLETMTSCSSHKHPGPCRFAPTFAFPVGTMPFISSTTGVLRVGHRSARLMHHHPLEQAKSSLFFCLQVTFLQNYNLAIQPDHVKNAQDLVQFSFARTCLGIIQRWTSCFSANKVLRTGPRGPGWRGTLKRVLPHTLIYA